MRVCQKSCEIREQPKTRICKIGNKLLLIKRKFYFMAKYNNKHDTLIMNV